jgi:SprT protein
MNQDSLEQFHQRLGKYIPSEAAPMVAEVMIGHDAFLRLTKNRHSKHGDYRAPFNGKGHIITINSTLNKYAFLLTLLHEFAHMTTWKKYGRNASPHGKEWKKEFSIITSPFIQKNIFPGELKTAISKYFLNPKASSCTDHNLQEALMKFDDQYEDQ